MQNYLGRLLLVVVALGMTGFFVRWQLATTAAQGGSCAEGNYLEESLPSSARWDLCWLVRSAEGVVLSEIHYTPPAGERRKILQEASLAQIEVIYDDARATLYPVSEPGLGGAQLLTLAAGDCPNGELLSAEKRTILCKQRAARGYLYKYYDQQRQGDDFTLFSATQIGQQLYIVQWRLVDDGTIEPMVGEGGRLWRQGGNAQSGWPVAANGTLGIGYLLNYWWRLDFDIGGNGANDMVEEFTVSPASNNTQRISSAAALTSEGGQSTDPDQKRSWRVRDGALNNSDGHAISYHLDPKAAGYRDEGSASQPWRQHDFYVTVAHPCERLAIHNPVGSENCGDNVAAFANDESLAGADIVVWYRSTTHRLPRAEDTPVLGVQWQGFQLLPRDWTAQNGF